ncbi:MAG: TraB/GumN family protein [Syntrophaceae bacterium]|nr:TraB/GumN family protein [Candidatus Dependentiae bacterium]MCG2740752.1 TraB/GumN family protein [Syntrophaceae bacterium]
MNLFPWQEKRLRTVWRVEKNGRVSFLVGTAHFSPISFRKTLTRLVQGSETVLFEGPLDEESMATVARYGSRGEDTPSVYDLLDRSVIREINRQLADPSGRATLAGSLRELINVNSSGFLEEYARGVRPWMAFFTTWSAFLNWRHSMDVEAFHIAQKLGKEIGYLETIKDQIEALDGIPFDKIVNYFNQYKQWSTHKERFTKVFIEGDVQNYLSITAEFPTRCESIIGKRDPIFFRGIKASFEKRQTTAFVGFGHTPGIRKMFLDEGYRVIQE